MKAIVDSRFPAVLTTHKNLRTHTHPPYIYPLQNERKRPHFHRRRHPQYRLDRRDVFVTRVHPRAASLNLNLIFVIESLWVLNLKSGVTADARTPTTGPMLWCMLSTYRGIGVVRSWASWASFHHIVKSHIYIVITRQPYTCFHVFPILWCKRPDDFDNFKSVINTT